MPKADRSSQINVVLPPEDFARLKKYVETSGFTLTHVVARAIRRDLANPPPMLPDPALPDAPPEAPSAKKPAAKRSRNT